MVILRRILFYFFITLYLVLCPLIILYALGYIFTPKVEEGFAKTGLIHLETFPANASIMIAGKPYAEKTPAAVRNLLAGTYEVKISKEGYRPWVREVEVEEGMAVAFDKVLLVPETLKTQTLIPQAFEDLLPVPGTRFLLLFKTKKAGDLLVFDWKAGTSRPLLRAGTAFGGAVVLKAFTVRESTSVLLQVKGKDRLRFLWCQLEKEPPQVKDISALFDQGEPAEVLWESARPEYLFARYGEDLSRLDLGKRKVSRNFMEQVQGFGLLKGKVYAIRAAGIYRIQAGAKKGEETLAERGAFLENLFRNGGNFKMDFISGRTLCFLSANGEFFANELPYRFVGEGLKGYHSGEEGERIVLWQTGRLGMLDFSKKARKKELFERGPEIDWVFEKGKNITEAYFVYDASHVLFRDGDQVFIIPAGEGDAPAERLVPVRDKSSVFYSDKTGKLYYLEPAHGHLCEAMLLPGELGLSGMLSGLEEKTEEVMK